MHNYPSRAAFIKRYVVSKVRVAFEKRNAIRWMPVALAVLILSQAILPTVGWLADRNMYQLSADALRVVGSANANLSAKFTYDKAADSWMFNKEGKALKASQIAAQQGTSATGVASALSQLQAQVGGGGKKDDSLYSVELPSDAKKGIKFYDNQTSQSFSMIPQFTTGTGKKWQGRVIYPFGNSGQVVYTAKTNGIKEDIVLNKFVSKELSYSYKLDVPNELEARLLEDGSVGVFSADPVLYSQMTYGSDVDKEKIESARANAEKSHLVFAVPAPIVKDAKNREVKAAYTLRGDILTVTANKLHELTYPVSIDPSVVVTSTSEFERGNDEGMIDYSIDGQITRARVSGGGAGTWTKTSVDNSMSPLRYNAGYAAYNNHIYLVGGIGNAATASAVHYATVNADGSVSAWMATTSMPYSRQYASVVAYNGYMYAYGGSDNGNGDAPGGQVVYDSVIYAPINTNGTIGAWQASPNTLAVAQCRAGAAMSNGFLYAVGGQIAPGGQCPNTGSTTTDVVQYAPILANGQVGTWSLTSSLPNARQSVAAAAYEGRIYANGGIRYGTGGASYADTLMAKVKDDGSLTAWVDLNSSTLTTGNPRHSMLAYKGYLYSLGGESATYNRTLQFARINADGTIGSWTASSVVPDHPTNNSARWSAAFVAYKDNLYFYSGTGCGGSCADTFRATLNPPGATSSPATTTNLPSANSYGYSATYNTRIYHIGGLNGSTAQTTARLSGMNATGTYGSWSTTTALASASYGGFSGIYNSKIYVIGGVGSSVVQYSTIAGNGALGTWSTTTPLPFACGNHKGAIYNGYIYYVCGSSGDGATTTVHYAAINQSDGTVGTWNTTSSLTTSVSGESVTTHAGYLYVVGGQDGATYQNTVQYARINTDGTLGAFANTTSMQESAANSAVHVLNGYIYRMGGENSTALSSVEYASINNNGTVNSWSYGTGLPQTVTRAATATGGERLFTLGGLVNGASAVTSYALTSGGGGGGTSAFTAAGTTLATAFPNGIFEHGTFAYKGYMYVIGGRSSTDGRYSSVWSAPFNDDGTVGTWTQQPSMNQVRSGFVYGIWGDHVYAYTGRNNTNNSLNTYAYAQLGPNGTTGSWTAEMPMSTSSGTVPVRQLASGGAYNGKLYALGGQTQASQGTTDAYFATINSDGSVGTWAQTTNFSGGRQASSAAFYNDYVYITGGTSLNSGGVVYTIVQFAKINSDGTLQAWNQTSATPTAKAFGQISVFNGRLYNYTGSSSSLSTQNVQSAPISPNGELGTWDTSSPNTHVNARYSSSGVIYQGRLYISGGIGAGATNYNDTLMTSILSSPRIARYSTLVDIGNTLTIRSVNFTGSSHAGMAIRYRTAPSSGVLSAYKNGVSGIGSEPPIACGNDGTRYVWIQTIMDDSMTVTFGAESTRSEVTSINMYYSLSLRPAPEQRLFGGKSFQQGILQAHDTCGVS